MLGLKRLADHKVIERIKQGDESMLVLLYKDHYTMIRNFVLKNSGDEGMVDDILQDAVIAVWKNVNKSDFLLQAKLSTYVMSIAKNLWFKELKKRTKFKYVDESEQGNEPSEEMKLDMDTSIIVQMVQEMDETCRRLLSYFYFDGLANKVIAEKLGFANTDTVKSKKYQCFKRLQERVRANYNKRGPALMNEEKTYHLINEYLSGELKGRALDEFKMRLKEDAAFAEQVKLQTQIVKAIKDHRESELRGYLKEHGSVNYFRNSWGRKWTYASAAILALFVSLFFVLRYYSPSNSEQSIATVTEDNASEKKSTIVTEDSVTRVDSNTLAINTPLEETPTIEMVEDDLDIDSAVPATEQIAEDVELDDEVADGGFYDMEEEEIKRDKLIATKTFVITSFSPRADTIGANAVIVTSEKRASKEKRINDSDADEVAVDNEPVSKAPAKVSKSITVEFWDSPINYVGYNYSSGKLKLYGIDQNTSLIFTELDSRLYMKVNSTHYFIDRNGKDNKLVEVTNPTLLKILNE